MSLFEGSWRKIRQEKTSWSITWFLTFAFAKTACLGGWSWNNRECCCKSCSSEQWFTDLLRVPHGREAHTWALRPLQKYKNLTNENTPLNNEIKSLKAPLKKKQVELKLMNINGARDIKTKRGWKNTPLCMQRELTDQFSLQLAVILMHFFPLHWNLHLLARSSKSFKSSGARLNVGLWAKKGRHHFYNH